MSQHLHLARNGDNVSIYSNGGWDGCLGAGGQWGAHPWETWNGNWTSCHAKLGARTLDMTRNYSCFH